MARSQPHLLNHTISCLLVCGTVSAQTKETVDATAQRPRVEELGNGKFRLGKIDFDQKAREISFAAKVNMNVGYLEYMIVNEAIGKVHESLLTTEASPLNLNVVLLLLGYQPSSALKDQKEDTALGPVAKASIDVNVQWKDSKGKAQSAPIESWVLNLALDAPAQLGHWLYTGSNVDESGGFAAETDGSIIAVYRDHRALINNPREGKTSDEIWKPAPQHGLPAKETPVTVIFRPHNSSGQPKAAAPAS